MRCCFMARSPDRYRNGIARRARSPSPSLRVHRAGKALTRWVTTSAGTVSNKSGSSLASTYSGSTVSTIGSHPNSRKYGKDILTRWQSGALIGGKRGLTISTLRVKASRPRPQFRLRLLSVPDLPPPANQEVFLPNNPEKRSPRSLRLRAAF